MSYIENNTNENKESITVNLSNWLPQNTEFLITGPAHCLWGQSFFNPTLSEPESTFIAKKQIQITVLTLSKTAARLRNRPETAPPLLLCHGPAVARRLKLTPETVKGYDLLELFIFVWPTYFCLPTPAGLAAACDLPPPCTPEQELLTLGRVAEHLLAELARQKKQAKSHPQTAKAQERLSTLGYAMAWAGWRWGALITRAQGSHTPNSSQILNAFAVWRRLAEISEFAPEPSTGNAPVSETKARAKLKKLLNTLPLETTSDELKTSTANTNFETRPEIQPEIRPEQSDYAAAVSAAFRPPRHSKIPELVIAEAGTGIGKTLGYLAPATLWAEKNQDSVWISTYTRNLQHQIDRELARYEPNPILRRRKIVLRKGRENYLCLLNLEEQINAIFGSMKINLQNQTLIKEPETNNMPNLVALGLMTRWVENSRDGDLGGSDFPAWLLDLQGPSRVATLADRRGECIYAACAHYNKCFVERSIRQAKRAEIVIANHALTLIQAIMDQDHEETRITHYVFDEGHMLFDAADAAFSYHLTGQEAYDLRRWLIGLESMGGRARRNHGLARRLEDLSFDDPQTQTLLHKIATEAHCLPREGWTDRLLKKSKSHNLVKLDSLIESQSSDKIMGSGQVENFLICLQEQIIVQTSGGNGLYGLEIACGDIKPDLRAAAADLDSALTNLLDPVQQLRTRFENRLTDESKELDPTRRIRFETMIRSLSRHVISPLQAWKAMLQSLVTKTPEEFVDWFAIDRHQSKIIDIGMHRHWIDPTRPFAETVLAKAQGVLITSATLIDRLDPKKEQISEIEWEQAQARCGINHLSIPIHRVHLESPFNYGEQTRILIIDDIHKNAPDDIATAFQALFTAAKGGALGLFTAISRLRAVYQRLAEPLDRLGLPLFAQHVDGMGTPTLIDIFRAQENSCLLGTDAIRDGVDVPGWALRLIVFDRVPWPRPNILHQARRKNFNNQAYGKQTYDDRLVRMRLKQGFGRLLRRATDRGVFVMLDSGLPSRLISAFPADVTVQRIGLIEAIEQVKTFLYPDEK